MCKMIILAFLLLSCCLPAYKIEIEDFELWDRDGLVNTIWCAVSVKDGGIFVRNLKLKDFELIETAYGKDGEFLASKKVRFDNFYYQFNGDGFWEKSVNSDKLDIVFLIDKTGSMEDHVESIKRQLGSFLDRLMEMGTDFRMVIAEYGVEDEPEWPSGAEVDIFYDSVMFEEINREIEEINTGGEGWDLTWAYDAFLWTLNLDWRESARKIVVIITDVYVDSVYGPNWYYTSGCNTSMHAVDLALKENEIYLYYCQPLEENMAKTELLESYSPQVNPKIKESNFDSLAKGNDYVKRLSWPFDQSEIPLERAPTIDSKYYFAWLSDWSEHDFVSRVEVEARLVGTEDSSYFAYYPIENPDGTKADISSGEISFVVRDESGFSMLGNDNVCVYFYKVMGNTSRMDTVGAMYQISDKNGKIDIGKRKPGRYYYILYASGQPIDAYHQLRFTSRGWVEIGLTKATPTEIIAYTWGNKAEIYKAYGLLKELEGLEITSESIKHYTRKANEWLSSLRKDGVTLVEMEALKRFNTGLAAIVNCAGYACVVQEKASNDTVKIVQKVSDMIRRTEDVVNKLESAKHIIMKTVNTFIDIITGNWSGAAMNLTIEEVVNRLVTYVRDDLLDDIMGLVEKRLEEVIRNPEVVLDFFKTRVREWIREKLPPDQIAESAYNFISKELVYNRFTSHIEEQLEMLLSYSKELVEKNRSRYWYFDDRSRLMRKSFEEMRHDLMSDLFEISYETLSRQNSVDDWADALQVFENTIPLIVEFLELFEVRYPELSDVKEALKTLGDALDTIGAMTQTYEMALKIDHLTTLTEKAQKIASKVYRYK
ncbi:VWA domain-containing protein [Thermotoga sp.]|uniref:VWA domain-containing protein n=1 Tax=Thermotoga sp. TaxID=28240 RepID=UPI0025F7FFDB|nr:VWA domain-containing protein [Thermotoga sp.]MCD6551187.1 VWA domain-containing protein [Thermotoga sp.]